VPLKPVDVAEAEKAQAVAEAVAPAAPVDDVQPPTASTGQPLLPGMTWTSGGNIPPE
jgi:hypothetical protein